MTLLVFSFEIVALSPESQAERIYKVKVSNFDDLEKYMTGKVSSKYDVVDITLTKDLNVTRKIVVGDSHIKEIILEGNNHTLVNKISPTSTMVYIPKGSSLTCSNIVLNGNKKKTTAQTNGTAALSNNGTCIMTKVTVKASYNYSFEGRDEGGGTGFENLQGTMTLNSCYATDCYGAAFWNGNKENKKAGTVVLNNCTCDDCAGGAYNAYNGKMTVNGGEYKTGNKIYSIASCNSFSGTMTIKGNAKFMADGGIALRDASTGETIIESGDFYGIVGIRHEKGTLTIKDCLVHDSLYGIQGIAKVIQKGGKVSNCLVAASIGSDYAVSGNTCFAKSDNANVLVLDKDCYLKVSGKLSSDFVGCFYLEDSDKKLGRKLIKSYSSDSSVNSPLSQQFTLYTTDIKFNADGSDFNGLDNSGAIRIGNGYNSDKSYIIFSGKYKAYYKSGLDYYNSMVEGLDYSPADYKDQDSFYYQEDFTVFDKSGDHVIKVLNKDGLQVTFLKNSGYSTKDFYNKNKNTAEYQSGQIIRSSSNLNFYGVYDFLGQVRFCGNGANNVVLNKDKVKYTSDGEMYFAQEISDNLKTPSVCFSRQIDNADGVIKYKLLGWSLMRNSTYKDSNMVALQDKTNKLYDTSYVKYALKEEKNKSLMVNDEGYAILPVYACWDQYPNVTCSDSYILKSDLSYFTEDLLIERCKAIGRDNEDGELQVQVKDFNKIDANNLANKTYFQVEFIAKDGVANQAEQSCKLDIIDDMSSSNVRFIDKENYEKRDSTSDKGSSKGALGKNSIWYLDQDYVQLIKQTFSKTAKESSHYYNYRQIKSYNL